MNKVVKRKALSISEKLQILHKHDENSSMNQKQSAESLGIPSSTLGTVIKNREIVDDVEKILVQSLYQSREASHHLSVPIIQQKAQEIADMLNIGYSASNGRLGRFKQRHAIIYRHINGESESKLKERHTVEKKKEKVISYVNADESNDDEDNTTIPMPPRISHSVMEEDSTSISSVEPGQTLHHACKYTKNASEIRALRVEINALSEMLRAFISRLDSASGESNGNKLGRSIMQEQEKSLNSMSIIKDELRLPCSTYEDFQNLNVKLEDVQVKAAVIVKFITGNLDEDHLSSIDSNLDKLYANQKATIEKVNAITSFANHLTQRYFKDLEDINQNINETRNLFNVTLNTLDYRIILQSEIYQGFKDIVNLEIINFKELLVIERHLKEHYSILQLLPLDEVYLFKIL
ncbi:hypothetical protein FQA39_LY14782 [Lamprigera yunnana]|nr:hypothetical protein FQA39_LY14782 [Lamprigera yunnana]